MLTGVRMRYARLDLDVEDALPTVALSSDEHGLAVLLRLDRRPIGFWMLPVDVGARITPEQLRRLLDGEAEEAILTAALRRHLRAQQPRPAATFAITVAVCTRDRPALLADCLRSVLAARSGVPNPDDVTVLVVDNAPSDEATKRLVDTLPEVRYAREPRAGLDFARNRALEEARGEVLAFVDDDVIVDGGWLAGLQEALGENPDAAAVTGFVLPQELDTDSQIIFERRGGFRRGARKRRYEGVRLPGNPLYPTGAGMFGAGCNMAFRRDVLLALGGFDEALDTGPPLPGGGDLDIFYRVVRSGRPLVYEPAMLVFHRHRRDHLGLRRQYWSWGTGFMAFVMKTYRTDPSQRRNLQRLVVWWLGYQGRELKRSLRGRSPLPPELVVAELAGGLVGLSGTYPRSVRRTARIRARIA